MRKKVTIMLPGEAEPAVVSYQGRSRQVVVVGADTEMGRALSRSLSAAGYQVIGLGAAHLSCAPRHLSCAPRFSAAVPCAEARRTEQVEYRQTDYSSFGVPDECNLVLYCHDAAGDTARHGSILERLCGELAATRSDQNQVSVCVFTPSSACVPSGRTVREDARLHPHSLRELACVQAEMALHAWYCKSNTVILPVVFRHGELYGIEGGHVAACLRQAHDRPQCLPLPGLGNQRRTLTHIDDFADAVATLLKDEFTPSPINIPGENMDVIEYMGPIADLFGLELGMSRDCFSEDLPRGVGDCALSAALFKSELPSFRPKHRFKQWLSTAISN